MKQHINPDKLAKALIAYMEKNNITQTELAEKLGVARSTLNRWQTKRCQIRQTTLRILKIEGIIS